MADSRDTRVCLGAIAGAHGVRGDVRIKTFTDDPMDIGAYGALTTEDGARSFEIGKARLNKDHVVAALNGVTTREAAQALKGTRLYVDRDSLPDLDEEDTWYHADLIGLEARGSDGALIGKVAAIYDFGAGDLIEIALEGSGKLVMVPFTAETVPEVDPDAGRLTLLPPEGLID